MKIIKRLSRGFTLVELLIVIAIIGILASMIIANVSGSRSKASDTKIKSDLNQLKTALQLYYNDYQVFPNASGVLMQGCGPTGASDCLTGNAFSAGNPSVIYMKELPVIGAYTSANDDSYTACTTLLNTTDPEATASRAKCTAGSAGQYCVCND